MLTLSRRPDTSCGQRGQVVVLFALLIPMFLGLGAIVLSVGNWYVHQKRLQTLVDAGAFAGGTKFTRCTSDPAFNGPANSEIKLEALKYGGDTTRDIATQNLQVQEPNDVHLVLNGDTYWSTNPYPPDDTLGDPCSVKFLDVKGTDDRLPLLWRVLPLFPSALKKARVQIEIAESAVGVLPFAVLDVDPLAVAAIFIDEETDQVIHRQYLNKQALPPGDPLVGYNVWEGDFADFDITMQNMGVIIMASKVANPPLPNVGALPPYTCNQAPTRWRCYSGSTGTSGLSFIHGYDDDSSGGAQAPIIKDVSLTGGSCGPPGFPTNLSAPYYTYDGPCSAGLDAVVDFGNQPNPPANPPAGIRAEVTANGASLTWSAGGIGGPLGTWSCPSCIGLPADSGRQVVNIGWQTQIGNGSTRRSGTFPKVAAPYVSNDASGPVQYLELACTSSANYTCPTILANSLPDEGAGLTGPTIHVTVGLQPVLSIGQKVAFRVASPPGSKNQALDCDKNRTIDEEILTGCKTPFALNYDKTTQTWRDLDCDDYDPNAGSPTFRYRLPVDAPYEPDPFPDCATIEPGDRLGQVRRGLHDRFESPCTPNDWDPTLTNIPSDLDRRWIQLVVTDATAFEGSGASPDDAIPVKYIGSFYVVGWSVGGQANGCPGENEPPPPGWRVRNNSVDVWGYFRWSVLPSSGGTTTGELCNFDGNDTCIAVLVE